MDDDHLVHALVQVYHLKDLVSDADLLLCELVLLKVRVHFKQVRHLFVLLYRVSENPQLVVKKNLESFLILVRVGAR